LGLIQQNLQDVVQRDGKNKIFFKTLNSDEIHNKQLKTISNGSEYSQDKTTLPFEAEIVII